VGTKSSPLILDHITMVSTSPIPLGLVVKKCRWVQPPETTLTDAIDSHGTHNPFEAGLH
jgi:hypothetical protein